MLKHDCEQVDLGFVRIGSWRVGKIHSFKAMDYGEWTCCLTDFLIFSFMGHFTRFWRTLRTWVIWFHDLFNIVSWFASLVLRVSTSLLLVLGFIRIILVFTSLNHDSNTIDKLPFRNEVVYYCNAQSRNAMIRVVLSLFCGQLSLF